MLKSSSLCLYSSNLGTFWLKIEQFGLFEEISIFSNGGHLGYRTLQKKSSPLKLFSQSQPNFAEMILGWSSSKIASRISEHQPRWPPQPNSSLCFYSSNLGTFCLKIEQFWLFEEISIFSNGGHLGYRTLQTDTILKGDHPRIISAKFGFAEMILGWSPFKLVSVSAVLYPRWPP
jgi:hypothetical protein